MQNPVTTPQASDEPSRQGNWAVEELIEQPDLEPGHNEDDDPKTSNNNFSNRRPNIIAIMIIIIGVGAASAIALFGIPAAQHDQETQFTILGGEILKRLERAVEDYRTAGLWLHQATEDPFMTHAEFRTIYNYMLRTNLGFQAVSTARNVSHELRGWYENQTYSYLQQNFPNVTYQGFRGIEPTNGTMAPGLRSTRDFYFPVHFVEPVENVKNRYALDFDIYSEPLRHSALVKALETSEPAVTERLRLLREAEYGGVASNEYSVVMMHPGVPEESTDRVGVIAIRIPEVLERAHLNFFMQNSVSVYIFDSTDDGVDQFLGGALLHEDAIIPQQGVLSYHSESSLKTAREQSLVLEQEMAMGGRLWTFVVADTEDSFQPNIGFVVLGSCMVLVACLAVAAWVWTDIRRHSNISALRQAAEKEKAFLMVESAREAAKHERELNDFISHEVRNPLSAAISANSFVTSAVNETEPLLTEESRSMVREDVVIIENSLQFINDLLRNMLDLHRAKSNRGLNIQLSPADLKHDIFDPVASMLYQRGASFKVEVDCPENLVIMTDRLRLKQIVINLARNSFKFVSKGFVRLRAEVGHDRMVTIFVEDSGPGIPQEKRKMLFAKFQESLDSLNQGTGIGLSLCEKLITLMGGEINLIEDYVSGIEGFPGAQFAIRLKTSPVELDSITEKTENDCSQELYPESEADKETELPENIRLLFVDDDFVLRKLFMRSVTRVTKNWKIQEAANGETAIRMIAEQGHEFDLVFVDQYMSSVDRQLLGTEAVRILRSRGCKAALCGLSANDMEASFLEAGADAFLMKPFPCAPDQLSRELFRCLKAARDRNSSNTSERC